MKAFCLVREQPWYRREAFISGLNALGLQVLCQRPSHVDRDTVLVIWNRYGHWHDEAVRVEAAGGRVIVAENGYLGRGGSSPKFDVHPGGPKPHHYYALAEGWHNGRGRWSSGGRERLDELGIRLKAWRTDGDHVLVCPNRSFGVGNQVMPPDWTERCVERLRKSTSRPVRVRLHPNNDAPKRALAEDLKGAWAVVVWSSSVAVHALAEGIPTFIEAPFQIVKGAGASGTIEAPVTPDRVPHFERLAWAQWRLNEIETGEPFRHLLQPAGKAEVTGRP